MALHKGAQTRGVCRYRVPDYSATDEVVTDLAVLQNRSRELRRDNSWVHRAVTAHTANVVGNGVKPRPSTPDARFNRGILNLWRDWEFYADYHNLKSIYSLQQEIVRASMEGGECFALIIHTKDDDSSPVPMQIQVLESDQCPISLNQILDNGNEIKAGIEIDADGRVVAYYFHRNHPNSTNVKTGDDGSIYVRYDRESVIHFLDGERPSQLRGRPIVTASISKAKSFDDYNEAEQDRKISRSKFTGAIERESFAEPDYKYNPITGEKINVDEGEVEELLIESGTFPALLAGEKLKLFNSDDVPQAYNDYQYWQTLGISAGLNVPYQIVTGDWRYINDRIWRAVFNQYKREITQLQDNSFTPLVLAPIWRAFVNSAISNNKIGIPKDTTKWSLYRAEYQYQTFPYIHPLQDIKSDIARMEAGLESRSSVINRTGSSDQTAVDVDTQRQENMEREVKLNIKEGGKNANTTK